MTENQDNYELNDSGQPDDTSSNEQDQNSEMADDIERQKPQESQDQASEVDCSADSELYSQPDDPSSNEQDQNSEIADDNKQQAPQGSQDQASDVDCSADSETDSQPVDDNKGGMAPDSPEETERDKSQKADSAKGNKNEQSDSRGKKTVIKGGKKPDKYRKHILCRYGKMGNLGYFAHDLDDFPDRASHVIVNTERGLEIAQIVAHDTCHKKGNLTVKESKINQYCSDSCDNFPLDRKGTVVRVAGEQDVREQQHLEDGVAKELNYCKQLIIEQNLDMTLVDAERLFGGERIIFYFMADGRVDFRQLVKDLAQQYQTRIEMRQIGARDEARLVADFETCGRECCCRSFLKVLYPVNMRMAKLQKATLDPSKISGRCGRLKCCLRFEDEVYNDHKKKLPKKNSIVLTKEGYGKVIDTHVLTLFVKVFLTESSRLVVVDLEDIQEFNYTPPEKPEKPAEDEKPKDSNRNSRSRSRDRDRDRSGRSKPKNGNGRPPRDNNNDREDSQKQQDDNQVASQNGSQDDSQQSVDGENKPKKKRRRRRRKKKPAGGDNNNNPDRDSSQGSSDSGSSSGGQGDN